MVALPTWFPLKVTHNSEANALDVELRLTAIGRVPLQRQVTCEELLNMAAIAFRVAMGSAFYLALSPSLYKWAFLVGAVRGSYEYIKLSPGAPSKYSYDVCGKIVEWMKQNSGQVNALILGVGGLAGVQVKSLNLPNRYFSAGLSAVGAYEGFHAGLLVGRRGTELFGDFVTDVLAARTRNEANALPAQEKTLASVSPVKIGSINELPAWVSSGEIKGSIIDGIYRISSEVENETWVLSGGGWIQITGSTRIIPLHISSKVKEWAENGGDGTLVTLKTSLGLPRVANDDAILLDPDLRYFPEYNAWRHEYRE